jgi:hypothetical protein
MSQPARPTDKWRASIKMGMMGGTLNWLMGAAILKSNKTASTSQAIRPPWAAWDEGEGVPVDI